MNAAEMGRSIFERRRPALSDRQVRVRLTSIDYQEWRLLALDGLSEAIENGGLTEEENSAALTLVAAGYFGRANDSIRELLAAAEITSPA